MGETLPDSRVDAARDAVGSACEDVRSAREDHVDGVPVGLVARPTSTAEVAEVMRAAAAHGLTVVARGAGTKLTWGTPPTSADLVVDLSAMDRVLDHAAGDLIVDTQAGTPLARLQETVAEQGQRLVLDETVCGATVGGTLSANTSGPERMLVGTARDLLIGVTVVRADGVVAKAGGRVVKNVAGYDLGKLVIGAHGTLAVITEAVFRLHPLQPERRWLTATADDAGSLHALAQAVIHSQAVPGAVEIDAPASGGGTIGVLLGGRPDGVAARVEVVRALLGEDVTVSDTAPDGWAAYPWDVQATGDTRGTALKLTFALSGLGTVLHATRAAGLHLRGSAGTGVAYGALASGTPVEETVAAVGAVRAACASVGGTCVVVDAPAAVKQAADVWGPVPALGLMRRVKDRFDPDHRLSPGRYVGGI